MLGSGAEKVYTGCERVMSSIAALVDGAKGAGGEGSHTILLLQMARPFPNVREAILSTDTHVLLDRLRSFRHRERNTYGFNLDPIIVHERASEAVKAFHHFQSDVARFLEIRREAAPL